MSKEISSFFGCPVSRDCKNNLCLLRQIKVFGYTPKPSAKNVEIERNVGKAYVPPFNFRVKGDTVQVVCPDYSSR